MALADRLTTLDDSCDSIPGVTMSETESFRLMNRSGLERALDAMAERMAADLDPSVVVLGILRRGGPLADQIVDRLEEAYGRRIAADDLKLKRYSDDLEVLHEQPELQEAELEVDLEGRPVVLVDDVLYSGRTFFRASIHVDSLGAESIHPATLCSRGPNDVPIEADYTGYQLDVGPENVIEVHAPPYEEDWGIELRRRPEE